MRHHRLDHTALLIALLVASCAGQRPATPPPTFEDGPTPHTRPADPDAAVTATIADLEFLAGRWVGEAFGGVVEESWNPPLGGEMLGTFRLVKDGAPAFYELMVLSLEADRPVLRLKHFNPGLVGWEEKDESVAFPLVAVTGTTAWFHGLTLHREKDALLGYLAMHQGGEVREVEFRFTLAPPMSP